jgi:hypothetical protein
VFAASILLDFVWEASEKAGATEKAIAEAEKTGEDVWN